MTPPTAHTTSPLPNASQNITNTHPMVTRAKVKILKPLERMNCHVTTTLPLPRSHLHALRDPNWQKAMVDEYNALISNGMWALMPRPANVNVVHSMWLFRHKFNADGSLSSPVVKLAMVRTVLSLTVSCDWPIHQLDVKNAFLHGQLSETVYMHPPPRFVDSSHPDYVCHLQRSLYGLKQAPRAWFQRFASFATRMALLQRIIALLHSEFAMTDLGSLNYFLGISAQRSASGMFLSQSKFVVEIIERAHMQNCNPCQTPVDTESKLGSDGEPVSEPTLYHSLAGALQYLTFKRPNLSYVVQQLHASSTTQLTAYTDADWAGCPITRQSTFEYCVFLGDNLLSWYAKRHVTLSRSSAEAEYRGVANVVAETAWICNLLREPHTPLFTATLVYCDNVNAVYMSANSVQHQRTKHNEIDIHFVRDFIASGQVRLLHVPLRFQYADIFTKGLPTALFLEFRSGLNVRRLTAQTAREY
ncbi:ribonuclease H-like domain-containing protein [Tanacetum coccineum]|uniref:Ribonuclease H-like domain-containing protein n=1 Tax=Tanacetum coccineum TaxID=301880 RepID=A0ABQ4YFD7_9ASTR